MNSTKLKNYAQKHNGNHSIIYSVYDRIKLLKNNLYKNHKINHYENLTPFFIVGSGRSGNTLLRSILAKNEEIVIPPESFVLGEAIRKYRLNKNLEWEDLCGIFCSVFERHHGFPRWDLDLREFYKDVIQIENKDKNLEYLIHLFYMYYAQKHKNQATRWGDKTPINTFSLSLINSVFRNSVYIHMIRDARDVVSSYIKAGFYDNIEDACHRWLNSVNTAKKFGNKISKKRYMEVKYEDLVAEPEVVIKKVTEFLNIDYVEDMLNHFEGINVLGDTGLSHHKNLKKPINTNSIGKWKEQLDEKDVLKILNICGDKMVDLGYKID
jgi:protein-tyrosine sulfotransferase